MSIDRPAILHVETAIMPAQATEAGLFSNTMLDYKIYSTIPRWWRKIEELLRIDLYLAIKAKLIANNYDIIWAGSEKVGIPLSFLGLKRPLVVVTHHIESPIKAKLIRATGIAKKWAGIGYVSSESRDFLVNYLEIPPDRLFQYESVKYLERMVPSDITYDGPILSAGVAKRDYNTFVTALAPLKGYEVNLFVSSKFGDKYKHHFSKVIPDWIHMMDFVTEDELIRYYHRARFVVVPLEHTTHSGAGINAVLESGAFCKAVIATNTRGMSSIVIDGVTGILVPPNDPVSLRNAVIKLWTDPDLCAQMGSEGRRFIESNYNPKSIKSNINTLLQKIATAQVNGRKI